MTASEITYARWDAFRGYGLRPFFLFGAIYAIAAMGAWLVWLSLHALNAAILKPTIHFPFTVWHAHEMLFGYGVAVVTGFLLTAVPTWTKSPNLPRKLLISLFALWLAGRAVMWFGAYIPAVLTAVVDIAYLPVLAVLIAGPIWQRRAKRNYVFFAVLLLFAMANTLTHVEAMGWTDDTSRMGLNLALNGFLVLLVVVGGRIVPAFTTGALKQAGQTDLPRSNIWIDRAAIGLAVLVLFGDLIVPDTLYLGVLALAAAAFNATRFFGWRFWHTIRLPIVWVLHAGYAWVVIGLAVKGLALLDIGISSAAAVHALTVGAIGTMTLAVMSRAALGHTGRQLVAPPLAISAYVCITIAAIVRTAGPAFLPSYYQTAMISSGLLWVAAFACFVYVYWPVLLEARIDGRPG